MSNFKCPMCTDCPKNCPLDTEEDTREHSADYYKGKADEAEKFAEKIKSDIEKYWYQSELDMGAENVNSLIDDALAERQKGN